MKELIVPANMALQWELFPGFGKKELLRTAIVSGFAALVLWIGTLIHIWNALIAIAAFLFIVTFSVQLFARTVFNTSLFDQLCMSLKQGEKGQTKFIYKKEEVQLFVCEENDDNN